MRSKGFTLVELLVAVSIVSLLSIVGFVSYTSANKRARDARRREDLKAVQAALELYFAANNSYPTTGGNWYSSEPGDQVTNNGGNYIPGITPTYMSILPRDPKGGTSPWAICRAGGWQAAYLYKSDGVNYKLLSNCGPENTWTSSDSFYDNARSTWAWKVCSDEPACSSW